MIAAAAAGVLAEQVSVILLALLAAFALLAAGRPELDRLRAIAMLVAVLATPVLLLAAIWDSPQVRPLRDHPLVGGAALVAGLVVVGLLAVLISRRREALPLLVIATLPFRVPIGAGAQVSNLLVPLYAVIAAAVLAYAAGVLRGRPADPGEPPAGRLEWALMALIVLYAAQAAYSHDFTDALKQIVFFYVPFTLLFAALRRVRWSRRLLLWSLGVLVALAVVFVAVGLLEYSRQELLVNPKLISANMVESYFRVNSLFFDPNIYGRFLAIVMLAITAGMLWSPVRREILAAAAALAVLWVGLMTSISQSSIAALLLGLGVLAALRFGVRRTLAVGVVLVAAGAVFVLAAGNVVRTDLSSSKKANQATTGRYNLIRGGVELFGERPATGFGAGSFALEYRRREGVSGANAVSASHTIPITIAAEQGVAGLLLYLVVLAAAFGRLFGTGVRESPERMALAAGFAALVLHTLLYADFLEDPVTWTLLGIGTALASPGAGAPVRRRRPGPAPAPA